MTVHSAQRSPVVVSLYWDEYQWIDDAPLFCASIRSEADWIDEEELDKILYNNGVYRVDDELVIESGATDDEIRIHRSNLKLKTDFPDEPPFEWEGFETVPVKEDLT